MTSVKRTVDVIASAKVQIADEIRSGHHFHIRYLEISKRANARIPAKLPRWAREYLRGYADALLNELTHDTDFRYLIGQTWISAKDLEYSNDCREPNTCQHSGHIAAVQKAPSATFWRGTDKVFYQSVDNIYGLAG